ncbi:Hsp20/alpha crystallin family protein [Methanohalophilus sp.]
MNERKKDDNNKDENNSFEDIEDLLQYVFEKMKEGNDNQPFVYGFSIAHNPMNNDQFNEQSLPADDAPEDVFVNNQTPLVETFKTDEEVYVTVDIKVDEDLVSISSRHNEVDIAVHFPDAGRTETQHVTLPASVDPDSESISCSHGVMDIRYKRKVASTLN